MRTAQARVAGHSAEQRDCIEGRDPAEDAPLAAEWNAQVPTVLLHEVCESQWRDMHGSRTKICAYSSASKCA